MSGVIRWRLFGSFIFFRIPVLGFDVLGFRRLLLLEFRTSDCCVFWSFLACDCGCFEFWDFACSDGFGIAIVIR